MARLIPLAGFALLAAVAAAAPASAASIKGTYVVTTTVTVNSEIADGTNVSASVSASSFETGFANSSSIQTNGTVDNGKVVFKASIPFNWTVGSATKTVSISVSASSSTFDTTRSTYRSTFISRTINLPKTGVTTKVTLAGAL